MSPRFDLHASIVALEGAPARVGELVAGLSEEALRRRPEGDGFSIKENVLHLRDLELQGYGPRLRRMLTEKNPLLPDVDGTRLAAERRYNEQPVEPALAEFRDARAENVRLLRRVTAQNLTRSANLETVGQLTVAQLIARWCDHDAEHLREIQALREDSGNP